MEATHSNVDAVTSTEISPPPVAFQQDPGAFLSAIAAEPPSTQSIQKLGGPVAKWFSRKPISSLNSVSNISIVAALYLEAAAVQLKEIPSISTVSRPIEGIDMNKSRLEIITAVGVCATLCKNQRGVISKSGILLTLGNIMLNGQTQDVNQLSLVSVEFLQCAILAEQYTYAARLVSGMWPRPDGTVQVKQVLRYFYLRGIIHLESNDYVMAHRCFWTGLSIPAQSVCKMSVDVWKKLVLVQCLMNDSNDSSENQIMLPKGTPPCLLQLLSSNAGADSIMKGGSGTKRPTPSSNLSSAENPSGSEANDSARTLNGSNSDPEATLCYNTLVSSFYKRDISKVRFLEVENRATFEKDGNLRYVQQCLTHLSHIKLRYISTIYSVVSTIKLADYLKIPYDERTQETLSEFLVESTVPCEIQEDGMVQFLEPKEQSATGPSCSPATDPVDLSKWLALLETIQQLDTNVLTSVRYQSLLKNNASSQGTNPAAAGLPRRVDHNPLFSR